MGMFRKKHLLGDILLSDGIVSDEQVKDALSKQRITRARLGEVLVMLGYAGRRDVEMALEKQKIARARIEERVKYLCGRLIDEIGKADEVGEAFADIQKVVAALRDRISKISGK